MSKTFDCKDSFECLSSRFPIGSRVRTNQNYVYAMRELNISAFGGKLPEVTGKVVGYGTLNDGQPFVSVCSPKNGHISLPCDQVEHAGCYPPHLEAFFPTRRQ